jgi:hypothetical protein
MKLLSGAPLLGRLLAFHSNDLAKLERLATNTLAYFLFINYGVLKFTKLTNEEFQTRKSCKLKKKIFFQI